MHANKGMRAHERWRTLRAGTLVLVITLTLLIACSSSTTVELSWTEDVALDDGRTIQVAREVVFEAARSWAGDAYNTREIAGVLRFKNEWAGLPEWNGIFMPMVLYQDQATGEWVIVATTTDCQIWWRNGMPWPNYWEFRLRDERWEEVPLSDASARRSTNLLIGYHDESLPKHFTVHAKTSRDRRAFIKYKKVMRDWDGLVCGETRDEWKARNSNGNSAAN